MTSDEILARRGEEFSINRHDLAAISLFIRDKVNPSEFRLMLDAEGWNDDDSTALFHAVRIAKRAKFSRGR